MSILSLLALAALVPDIGLKVSTFGFVWTIYRFLSIASLLLIIILDRGTLHVNKGDFHLQWIKLMIVWVLYGFLSMQISTYSDRHAGYIELLSILNGSIILYVSYAVSVNQDVFEKLVKTIRYVLIVFLIIGFVEISTGKHLNASMFNDTSNRTVVLYNLSRNVATGLMYNQNDFSAFITSLNCVCFYQSRKRTKWIYMILVFIVNIVNNATICNSSIIVGLLFYYLILNNFRGDRSKFKIVIFILLTVFIILFGLIFDYTDSIFGRYLSSIDIQISNVRLATGSLYKRLIIYFDSIRALIRSWFLGVGPSGITNYFKENPSISGLTDPHALLLEILSQYGVLIFTWFVVLLVKMFNYSRRGFFSVNNDSENRYLMSMQVIITYVIVSFAPSTFIGYSYQWLLIAVCCNGLQSHKTLNEIRINLSAKSLNEGKEII